MYGVVGVEGFEPSRLQGHRDLNPARLRNSFDADTQVLSADGTTKPITEVKPGDKVAAADPTDGHFEGLRTVEARLVHQDSDRLDLTVKSASGKTAVIHTTDYHAFWDDTRHAWVIAAALLPGHGLSTPADGHATVARKANVDGAADMYNLTVDDLHTRPHNRHGVLLMLEMWGLLPDTARGSPRTTSSRRIPDLGEDTGLILLG